MTDKMAKYLPIEGGREQTLYYGFQTGGASVLDIVAESLKVNEGIINILRYSETTEWDFTRRAEREPNGG